MAILGFYKIRTKIAFIFFKIYVKIIQEEIYMHYKEYQTILSKDNGMNIYRGCTHGCIYCDSRSVCYHIGDDFTDVEVKKDAPMMLEKELLLKRNRKIMISTGAMGDPYCHLEKELEYTRKCLEVIEKYKAGIVIQTKSTLLLRDLDLLKKINEKSKVVVEVTLTTASDKLCKIVEPNVSVTSERVKMLKKLQREGIKTIVWLCPFLPYINDTEENLLQLLDYIEECKVYGIIFFGFGLTLREGNREYFYKKLDESFPSLKERYIKEYGNSYEVNSKNSKRLYQLLVSECKKRNIILGNDYLFSYLHEFPQEFRQISLF